MAQVKKNEKYKVAAPIINLGSETYKYNSEEIGRAYDAAKPVCPTDEELKNARQYENSVPDFEMKEGDNSSAPPRQSFKGMPNEAPPLLASSDVTPIRVDDIITTTTTNRLLPDDSDNDIQLQDRDIRLNVYPSAYEN